MVRVRKVDDVKLCWEGVGKFSEINARVCVNVMKRKGVECEVQRRDLPGPMFISGDDDNPDSRSSNASSSVAVLSSKWT